MTITVAVTNIEVRGGCSLGFGWGTDDDGNTVSFAGDHRPMTHIAEALIAGEDVTVDLEPYQVLSISKGKSA